MARDEILARLRERIVLFAASHLSRDVAEDLAQEVLMLLHEKYVHLERVEDLLPLSLQIYALKSWRCGGKSVRHGEYTQVSVTDIPLPDLDANPADAYRAKGDAGAARRAMGQLGERCRELIRLKLQGKRFPEIQKIMGAAAINTIYTWDHRCRKHLLELMGGIGVGSHEPGRYPKAVGRVRDRNADARGAAGAVQRGAGGPGTVRRSWRASRRCATCCEDPGARTRTCWRRWMKSPSRGTAVVAARGAGLATAERCGPGRGRDAAGRTAGADRPSARWRK